MNIVHKRLRAHSIIRQLDQKGKITRPDTCELCQLKPAKYKSYDTPNRAIVAHHHKGYDYPTDIWWICQSCNHVLKGKHDGSLTKEEAQRLVINWPGHGLQSLAEKAGDI